MNKTFPQRISITPDWFAAIMAAYFTIFFNHQFWCQLLKTQTGFLATERWQFMSSVAIILWIFHVIFLVLLFWGNFSRYLAAILYLTAASASYFTDSYGVHYDVSMIENIFSTNRLEARELFTKSLMIDFLKHLPFVIFILFFIKIKSQAILKLFFRKLLVVFLLFSLMIGLIFFNYKNISSIVRNHREVKYLIIPASYLFSGAKLLFSKNQEQKIKKQIDGQASISAADFAKKKLVILVVGETVRVQNWGLSGYARNTTPKLSGMSLVNYPYVETCGTNTETSLPCMFSPYGKRNYDKDKIKGTESVLHFLKHLNVDVTWIDNQSGCKGVCDSLNLVQAKNFDNENRFCKESGNCYDEILVDALNKSINPSINQQLIVLHELGNHGPAYYERYPKDYEKFYPVCASGDLSACKKSEILNAYDNAILYTDHVLHSMIKSLDKIQGREVYFIYVSDHGESLGESNLYLHGLPYAIAPEYQTHSPMFIWVSGDAKKMHSCLSETGKKSVSHDNIYHTLLGIYNVQSKSYEPSLDLMKQCHN